MALQWTVHIPQAMQRHGGSVKPNDEPDCEAVMAELFRSMRTPEAQPVPESKTATTPVH